MKFIKQNKDSDSIVNLELCETIHATKVNLVGKHPFCIRFEFNDEFDAWYYEKKSDRDTQFIYICELANVERIGN